MSNRHYSLNYTQRKHYPYQQCTKITHTQCSPKSRRSNTLQIHPKPKNKSQHQLLNILLSPYNGITFRNDHPTHNQHLQTHHSTTSIVYSHIGKRLKTSHGQPYMFKQKEGDRKVEKKDHICVYARKRLNKKGSYIKKLKDREDR